MKVLSDGVDKKSLDGMMLLALTDVEDFYVLSGVVEKGDIVEASTTRKLSLDGGRTQQKISLRLAVRAEEISFDLKDGMMSVKGKVSRENEYVQQGSYHTIHVQVGDKLSLSKNKWRREWRRAIQEATVDVPSFCFVIFYDRECVVSVVSSGGAIKIVYKGELKSKNYRPIIGAVLAHKESCKGTVIAGFSSAGNEFQKALVKEDKSLEKQINLVKLDGAYKNLPNSKVVGRMLTDKALSKMFAEVKYVDDLREMGSFFESFDRGNKSVCVGLGEIKEALDYGAVKTFFITDALYRPRSVDERKWAEGIVAEVQEYHARVCVIPVEHELGQRLSAVGGLAASLAFSYK